MAGSLTMPEQRRGRRIAMTTDEVDAFLTSRRTARFATVGLHGPHVAPVWFVWDGSAVWISSLTRSQRWTDLARDPRVALVVDAGEEYVELHGVEIRGVAEVVGEVPRQGQPDERLAVPERLFAEKYFGTDEMPHDERHAWVRVAPDKMVSWDFRKTFGMD